MNATAGLLSLFVGSMLASTLLPGGVEILLYAMFKLGHHASLVLLAVATVGNTLGGLLTYAIGRLLQGAITAPKPAWLARIGPYFTLKPAALGRVQRYGAAALLLSWLPIIGDPLCLAAGYLKLPFWPSAVMIAIGKFLRYWVLLWLFGWR